MQQEDPINSISLVMILTGSGFSIGGLGLYWASRRVSSSTRHNRWVKLITYFCLVHSILLSALLGSRVLITFFFLVLVVGAWELRRAAKVSAPGQFARWVTTWAIYLLLSVGVLEFIFRSTPQTVVFVYLVVATFDGFSQVAGQLFGQHRLVGKISPGKTIEGACGGLIFAAIMALLLRPLLGLTIHRSLAACLLIVLFGLTGDLAASWLKRKSGLKDFGTILPGHGGFLDRFDSFLFAGPACFAFFFLRT